jgi:DNA-directed RNA polymerase specialized sigma24 family protein
VDDPAVVAAVTAGELDGLATALDRYAAALYDYCYATVPAVAAKAVRDTFVIAWSSIDRLRDPAERTGSA